MSRFRNLEFDGEARERDESPRLKDQDFYLAEARAAFESGRFEPGLRAYAKVLEFNPRHAESWAGQVRMLIELGEFREAALWADKALELMPNEPELLAGKAVALARSGDLSGALAFSDAAIEERGNSSYVWLARADVMLARNEKTADYCIEKALLLASSSWFCAWLCSRIYSFYRQFAKALSLAQRAVEAASERAVTWLQLGHCQFALGLAGQARQSWEQACQLDPGLDNPWERSGSKAGAMQWWRGRWRRWFGS